MPRSTRSACRSGTQASGACAALCLSSLQALQLMRVLVAAWCPQLLWHCVSVGLINMSRSGFSVEYEAHTRLPTFSLAASYAALQSAQKRTASTPSSAQRASLPRHAPALPASRVPAWSGQSMHGMWHAMWHATWLHTDAVLRVWSYAMVVRLFVAAGNPSIPPRIEAVTVGLAWPACQCSALCTPGLSRMRLGQVSDAV